MRFSLVPLDLYVRHTSRFFNLLLKWLLPLIEPTRHDKTLRKFPNYAELRASPRNPARTRNKDYPLASSTARSEIFDHGETLSRNAR